jgi:hypothetical protein
MVNTEKRSITDVWFSDVNNIIYIIPSEDFDAYDYNLFLNFASQAELEGDYCVSETFTKIEGYKIQGLTPKIEGYKIQGLTPRVDVLEDEESGELEEVIKYVMKYYEPQRTSKTTAPKP